MTDQKIYTLGPADPKAGFRTKIYAASALILPGLGLLATFGILSSDQVNHLTAIVTGVMGLLGFGVAGMAAAKTSTQVGNGTFDPAPEPVPAPERNAFDALDQLQTQVNSAVDQAQAKVAEGVAVIQGAAAMIPGGKVVSDVGGPLGDLLKAVTAMGPKA